MNQEAHTYTIPKRAPEGGVFHATPARSYRWIYTISPLRKFPASPIALSITFL
jgi:hypothetical protein